MNAMAESLVDSYKTELVKDRVWRTTSQLELATVEWVAWYNSVRLHSALGYHTPQEIEAMWAASNDPRAQPGCAKTASSAAGQ